MPLRGTFATVRVELYLRERVRVRRHRKDLGVGALAHPLHRGDAAIEAIRGAGLTPAGLGA